MRRLGAEVRNEGVGGRDALPILLLVITFTTGLIDAVSVIGLGNVFVASMTGNVLFFGFAMAGAPGFAMDRNATALAAFLVGAVIAGRMARLFGAATRRSWLLSGAAVEGCLLLAATYLANGYDLQQLEPPTTYYSLVTLTAIAMGFRSGTVRKLGVANLPTTVLTQTLTSLASDAAAGQYKGAVRRLASVGIILLGAFVGGLLVLREGIARPLLAAAVIVVVASLAYAWHPSSAVPAMSS